MRIRVGQDPNAKYEAFVIISCVLRTVILGVALWLGPFFVIKNASLYFTVVPFINVLNLFQMIFMLNVLQTKNIFQFKLYIPIVLYALVSTALIIQEAFRETAPFRRDSTRINIARWFLIGYATELVAEIMIWLFFYRQLKAEFLWTTFKRIGVSTEANSKLIYL
jgi:hypothetical protein